MIREPYNKKSNRVLLRNLVKVQNIKFPFSKREGLLLVRGIPSV